MTDKVYMEIRSGDANYVLMTTIEQARDFREAWQDVDGVKILTITGTTVDLDANGVEISLDKETITGIYIREILSK